MKKIHNGRSNKMPDVTSVLSEKYKGMEWSLNGSPTSEAEFKAGFTIHEAHGVEEPTWSAIQTELTKMQAAYDAKEYQRKRAKEYPAIEDQLDDLYHNGIDGWKATIKVTKDKYPKG
jgi:hypothetical protein